MRYVWRVTASNDGAYWVRFANTTKGAKRRFFDTKLTPSEVMDRLSVYRWVDSPKYPWRVVRNKRGNWMLTRCTNSTAATYATGEKTTETNTYPLEEAKRLWVALSSLAQSK